LGNRVGNKPQPQSGCAGLRGPADQGNSDSIGLGKRPASAAITTEPLPTGNWSRAQVAALALSGQPDPRPLPAHTVRAIVGDVRSAIKKRQPGVAARILMFHLAELPDVRTMLGASQWWARDGVDEVRASIDQGTCGEVLNWTDPPSYMGEEFRKRALADARDLSEHVRSALVCDALASCLVWHAMTSRMGVASRP
jgi:hypothetical protein